MNIDQIFEIYKEPEEFSEKLVDQMLKLINGEHPADELISVSLSVRESA